MITTTPSPVTRPRWARRILPTAVLAATLTAVGLPAAAASPTDDVRNQIFGTKTVVARGLDNPRQLSLVGNGQLYIAEAGHGGSTCIGEGEDALCVGGTGAISQILVPQTASNVTPRRIVTGLFSGAGPSGAFATGADGVSAASATELYIAVTGGDPEGPVPPGADQAGKLLRSGYLQPTRVIADIAGYEAANDPDGQGVESNPYATLVVNKNLTLVADAAANTVLAVSKQGAVSVFAVLPNITGGDCDQRPNEDGSFSCDFVPTSLALGPDGGIYVGGLGAEAPGAGTVIKYSPAGAPLATWTGFTDVTGVAVGSDGSLYVSELFAGDVVKVAPGGARSAIAVPFPAGLAVDAQSNVYVAAYSVAPATGDLFGPDSSGQIWRIRF